MQFTVIKVNDLLCCVTLFTILILMLMHSFQFKVKNEWWTWIDYDKFHTLVKQYNDSNGEKVFSAEDYMARTPHWAVFGAKEQGFDPGETRFFRKKQKDIAGCWFLRLLNCFLFWKASFCRGSSIHKLLIFHTVKHLLKQIVLLLREVNYI